MVSEQILRRWVRDVRRGKRTAGALIDELRRLPFEDIGVARLDTHRRLRRGLPEGIFCDGKSPEQLIPIVRRLTQRRELVLLTRLARIVLRAEYDQRHGATFKILAPPPGEREVVVTDA